MLQSLSSLSAPSPALCSLLDIEMMKGAMSEQDIGVLPLGDDCIDWSQIRSF